MNNDLHEIQGAILRELIFNNGTTFSALNTVDIGNDHFTFHLKRLVKEGMIEKKGKLYFLTQKGKMFAGKLDTDALVIEKQGTPSVSVTARKMIKGEPHFLVQKRMKEPFYGLHGFIHGKIRFGEFVVDAAKREFHEETGLSGEPHVLTVGHRIGGPSRDNVNSDNFFFMFVVWHPKGKLLQTKEGKNSWKTIEEIRKLRVFPSLELYIDILERGTYTGFFEHFIELKEI